MLTADTCTAWVAGSLRRSARPSSSRRTDCHTDSDRLILVGLDCAGPYRLLGRPNHGLPVTGIVGVLVHPAESRMRRCCNQQQLSCRLSCFADCGCSSSFHGKSRTCVWQIGCTGLGHGTWPHDTMLVDMWCDRCRYDTSGIGATREHFGRVAFGAKFLIHRQRAVARISRVPSPRSFQRKVQQGSLAGGLDRG